MISMVLASVRPLGVAFADTSHDQFYSMGEGTAGVVFTAAGHSATTAAAGGYSLALGADIATAVVEGQFACT